MPLDASMGTISEEDARRLGATDTHNAGSTEPWVIGLVVAFVKAIDARRVLECGAFVGDTTEALADSIGEGWLIAAEIDEERAITVRDRLSAKKLPGLIWRVEHNDALSVIADLPENYLDLAFIDDDHTKDHVREEVRALWPKVRPGGLILFHDVYGACDLQEVVAEAGGYCVDLPRLGPAGGLGILQVTP